MEKHWAEAETGLHNKHPEEFSCKDLMEVLVQNPNDEEFRTNLNELRAWYYLTEIKRTVNSTQSKEFKPLVTKPMS